MLLVSISLFSVSVLATRRLLPHSISTTCTFGWQYSFFIFSIIVLKKKQSSPVPLVRHSLRGIEGDVRHVAHCQRAQRGRSAYYIANVLLPRAKRLTHLHICIWAQRYAFLANLPTFRGGYLNWPCWISGLFAQKIGRKSVGFARKIGGKSVSFAQKIGRKSVGFVQKIGGKSVGFCEKFGREKCNFAMENP